MKKLPKLLILSLLTLTSLTGCDNGGGDSLLSQSQSSNESSQQVSSSQASSEKESSSAESSQASPSSESSSIVDSSVSSSEDSSSIVDSSVSSSEDSSSVIEKYKISVIKDAFVNASFLVDGNEISIDDEILPETEVIMNLTFESEHMLKDAPDFSLECNLETISEGVSYKFKMPKGNLTITLTSKEVEKQYHEVKSVDIISTSYIEKVEGVAKGQDIQEGKTVEVELTAKSSSYTQFAYAIVVNGKTIKLEQDSTNSKLYKGSFEMPSEDIEVKAIHIMKQATEEETSTTIVFDNSDLYDIYGLESGGKYKCAVGTDYNYDSCKPKFYVIKKRIGVKISKVEWYVEGSTSSHTLTDSSDLYDIYLYNYTSEVKDKTIHIKVTASDVGTCTINIADTDKVSTDLTQTVFTATEKVIIAPKAIDGYFVTGLESIIDSEGNDLTSSGSFSDYTNKLTISSLPKGIITIKFKISKTIKVEVDKGEYIESCDIKRLINSYDTEVSDYAIPGKEIRIIPTLKEDVKGKINKVYFNGVAMSYSSYKGYYCTVPLDTTSISITFDVAFSRTITLNKSDEFEIYSAPTTSTYKDETITFKLREKSGYKIESVKLSNGTECSKESLYNCDQYSFTMPDEDVEIIVKTVKVTTCKVTLELGEGVKCTLTNKYSQTLIEDNLATISEGEKLNGKLTLSNGFKATSVTYGGEVVSVTDNKFEITVSKDATLKVETSEEEKHSLTINKINPDVFSSVTVRDQTSYENITGEDLKCYVGHKIRITPELTTAGKNDYLLNEASFSLKNSQGKDVEFTSIIGTYSTYIEFTMPSDDVSLTITPSSYPTVNSIAGENANLLKVVEGYFSFDSTAVIVPGTLKQGKSYRVYLNDPNYDSSKSYKLLVTDSSEKTLKSASFTSEHDYWSFDVGTLDVTISVQITSK